MLGPLVPRTKHARRLHGNLGHIQHNGQRWYFVESEVDFAEELSKANPNTHWVSLGGAINREKLCFDTSSAHIRDLTRQVERAVRGHDVKAILQIINQQINAKALHNVNYVENKLDELVAARGGRSPVIMMDELIDKGWLVCRQKALIAAHLMAHLVVKKLLPAGNVRQYRSDLPGEGGAHTWSIYRDHTTGHLWHCDPHWNAVKNASTDTAQLVDLGYGKLSIDTMLERADALDAYNPFVENIKPFVGAASGITFATINKGTLQNPGQQVRLELKDKATEEMISTMLKHHHVQFATDNHPNPFVIIRAKNNPALFTLDFKRLALDAVDYLLQIANPKQVPVVGPAVRPAPVIAAAPIPAVVAKPALMDPDLIDAFKLMWNEEKPRAALARLRPKP